ncbi:MAG: transcriptional regulator [Sphingobacteriaceae bacterium]|nr:MAG: transcriptional regulator [Sphingobacteriaceae bacterium]
MEAEETIQEIIHSNESCTVAVTAVKDALYVLSGKWKLPILILLIDSPKRFNELQKQLETVTPKILSKELRDLEMNELIIRKVYPTIPVTVVYEATPYSETLKPVLTELRNWGFEHRQKIIASRKSK